MKLIVEITLIELYDRQNCWNRDFAVLIDAGKGQKMVFVSYPDHWEIYIKLKIHEFYYN